MATFYATLGDAGTVLSSTLGDDDGAVDLTGATVEIHARHRVAVDAFSLEADPDPDQSTNPGLVSVTLTSTELDPEARQPGEFDLEWQVTNGSFVGTFPSRDPVTGHKDTLVIAEQLA